VARSAQSTLLLVVCHYDKDVIPGWRRRTATPGITCWQTDCLYNVDGQCRAEEIEYDPSEGCLTMVTRLVPEDSEDEERWELGGMHLRRDEDYPQTQPGW